ncbi:MAG: Hsp70 family protein [Candidatus Bipolaricaulaceae bacterium]
METLGGRPHPVIKRNTTVPVERTKTFTTAEDFQNEVVIRIYAGEHRMAADNKCLGQFVLSGIRPAARGVPQIDVTFAVDVNGILHVKAKDRDTQAEASITIKETPLLNREEVERMREEAKRYAEEDRRKLEEAKTRNEAESLIHAVVKALARMDVAPEKEPRWKQPSVP